MSKRVNKAPIDVEAAPVSNVTHLPTTLATQVRNNLGRVEQALRADPLFRDDPKTADTETAVAAFAMLNEFIAMVEERKAGFRKELLERAEHGGVPTPKGGQRLWADDNEVIRERRQAGSPNETDLRILLLSKNIQLSEVFDEVKVSQFNASKLQYLIDCGKLKQAEVDELYKVSWALKVKKSELVEKLLNDFSNIILGLPLGTKRISAKKLAESGGE